MDIPNAIIKKPLDSVYLTLQTSLSMALCMLLWNCPRAACNIQLIYVPTTSSDLSTLKARKLHVGSHMLAVCLLFSLAIRFSWLFLGLELRVHVGHQVVEC